MKYAEILEDLEGFAHKLAKSKGVDYYYHGYEKAVEHAEQMGVIVFGDSPEDIIDKARPNENPQIKKYRVESYEPEVLSHYRRITNVVSSIFNPASYSVAWPETPSRIEEKDSPEQYFSNEYGVWKSLINYVSGCGVDSTFAEPDAVIYIDPRYIEGGYPEPVPVIIPTEKVIDVHPGRMIWAESEEKSEVITGGGRKELSGKVYLVFTRDVNYVVEQYGSKNDYKFRIKEEDRHEMGELTARMLGGIVESRGMFWHYRSFISGVLPSWNMAIRRSSDFEGMMINHMVSQRIRINTACRECRGEKFTRDSGGEKIKCGSCNGTGAQISVGPYEDLVLNPESDIDLKPSEIIHYAQQPIDQAEFIRGDIEKRWQDGFKSVVMEVVNAVGMNQSGKAKEVDLTHLNQWLGMLTRHFWDLAEWMLRISIKYRYGTILGTSAGPNYDAAMELMPKITRPHKFETPTVTSFIDELKALGESNVHPTVSRERQKDLIAQIYGEGSPKANRLIAELELDPYGGLNPDDKLAIGSRGNLDRVDSYISDNLGRVLAMAELEKSDFYSLPRAEQLEILRELSLQILTPKEGEVVSDDAESQAKLRGSVGGITGIVALAQAVARGEMSEEAAEAIMVRMYGLTPQEAQRMVELGEIPAGMQEPPPTPPPAE